MSDLIRAISTRMLVCAARSGLVVYTGFRDGYTSGGVGIHGRRSVAAIWRGSMNVLDG